MSQKERKRPGMPRKRDALDRITLRLSRTLARRMNAACDSEGLTQRDFIEDAVKLYCETPIDGAVPAVDEDTDLYRTGMWITPGVVRLMDAREVAEGITQRALLERAVRHRLERA